MDGIMDGRTDGQKNGTSQNYIYPFGILRSSAYFVCQPLPGVKKSDEDIANASIHPSAMLSPPKPVGGI